MTRESVSDPPSKAPQSSYLSNSESPVLLTEVLHQHQITAALVDLGIE